MRTTATGIEKTKGMSGWRMHLLLAAAQAGIIGLIWIQGLGRVDAQESDVDLEAYVTVVVEDDPSDPGNPGSNLSGGQLR